MVGGEIRGARGSNEFRSFFAMIGNDARSHTKISIQKALVIIFCWAKDLSLKQTKQMLDVYGVVVIWIF